MFSSRNNCVWVAGEVLIDLIPREAKSEAIVGGGPANTAVALSRLGIDTYFIDGISTDDYGQAASKVLLDAGVNLEFARFSDMPTCTAMVSLDKSGSATYEFIIDGTATFDFGKSWLPDPSIDNPKVLYLGTLAALIEPGASALLEWAKEVAKYSTVIYDPNVRTSVLSDRHLYQESVDRWASLSHVIKVSSDDVECLYPGENFEAIAEGWFDVGVKLAVLTRGSKGLLAVTPTGTVSVPGLHVDVVDTVGAGDTVGAILAEAVVKYGIEKLQGSELEKVLTRAAMAAAITCSRAGAQPPTAEELDSY